MLGNGDRRAFKTSRCMVSQHHCRFTLGVPWIIQVRTGKVQCQHRIPGATEPRHRRTGRGEQGRVIAADRRHACSLQPIKPNCAARRVSQSHEQAGERFVSFRKRRNHVGLWSGHSQLAGWMWHTRAGAVQSLKNRRPCHLEKRKSMKISIVLFLYLCLTKSPTLFASQKI